MRTRLALSLLAAWTLLAALPAVSRADFGHRVVFRAAADAYLPYQWGIENNGATAFVPAPATPDADIDAPDAWTDGYDGSGQTVAVVDTQIDTTNSDIQPQLSSATPGPDVPNGPDCPAGTPKPDHGTAVAGVVAAAHDTYGITGVAPAAKILPVPALDDCGNGTPDTVKAAFDYAITNGARVIVASFATDPLLDPTTRDAVGADFDAYFRAHDTTLFVVAAGNEGVDLDNPTDPSPVYPCSSTEPNVVCVGASAADDSPSCESNVGGTSVDLFAPGEGIYSDFWSVGKSHPLVQPLSGTSMAAPMVAGVAALVAPTLDPMDPLYASELADALRNGADPRHAMHDISAAHGRLNAVGALFAAGQSVTLDGGEGNTTDGSDWVSCDVDHDGVRTANCTTTCDNCPDDANPDQANADGDALGDACDPSPRGDDTDGDGIPRLDDACPTQAGTASHRGCPDSDGDGIIDSADSCPTQYATTANGCPVAVATPTPPPAVTPTPTPTPTVTPIVPLRIVSVAVKVAHSRHTARVTVRLTRTASTNVTVERLVKHRWTRVLRRSFSATAGGRGLTVRTRRRGSYRVTVVLAGAKSVRRGFRV